MIRYIHGKDWDAKLLEALVSERMKPSIIENCPKIQIGGIKNNSSAEHLMVLKTWMKTMETQNKTGIFQAFDMEKFFDKEGLVDTLHTMYTKGKISEKDYRLWFKLNNRTRISIITPVGETDNATIMNGIGQGSFAAALGSSINIGSAVHEITKDEATAKIGDMSLNCSIFQDDIAKMIESLENARKGAKDIGMLLESKQLRANSSKSKFVIIGQEEA